MATTFEHVRGSNPLGLATVRTIFIVNLCNRPECEHPILYTSTDRQKAEDKLHELAQAAEPGFRLDLYRCDTLINDQDVYTPLLHVDEQGVTAL